MHFKALSLVNFASKKLCSGKNLVKLNTFLFRCIKVTQYCTVNKMEEENLLKPSSTLHGTKVLNKDAFRKTITVPCLIVKNQKISAVMKLIKNYVLKLQALKSVADFDENNKKFLLNPNKISTWKDFEENIADQLQKLDVGEKDFSKEQIELNYENWGSKDLLKAVLPKDEPPLTSFAQIGHIVQLNVKDRLQDYKQIIAEIIFDKFSTVKTVVCKKSMINNVFRNLEMDLLCGEPNYFVSVREGNCFYEFDFSKVYWNPRLNTEHKRVTDMIKFGDVLFDVFAGVGPFAIPAAKKKCSVFANDLNPDSIKWLNHNITLNKQAKDYIKTYNKDGGDFILTDLKENLIKTWKNEYFNGEIHIVMNLPAIAPTFIKYFKGLITSDDLLNLDIKQIENFLPTIHCYYFVKYKTEKTVFEEESEIALDDFEHSIHYVRKVSRLGDMYRVTFKLTVNFLLAKNAELLPGEPLPKKLCAS